MEFTSTDGLLGWGAHSIKDEDVIAVVESGSSDGGFTILSLKREDDNNNPFELHKTPAALLPKNFLDRWLFAGLPAHLRDSQIYILISIKSGSGLASNFFTHVLQPVFELVGLPSSKLDVVYTTSVDSVKQFFTSTILPLANQGKKQTLVLLSGDGGIVDAINAIEHAGSRSSGYARPVVALFPLGTGNALFHSLHKSPTTPSIYTQGIHNLLRGNSKKLPIFQAKFSSGARLLTNEGRTATPLHNDVLFGAVVASYGLHATLVADSDTTEWRKHGDKRFGLVAQNLVSPVDGSKPHAYRADVLLRNNGGEKRVKRDAHGYLLLTLVSNLEKKFIISPDSTPLDGKLRLIHFGPLDGKEVMSIMNSAYDGGKHVQRDEVGYCAVEGMRIDFREEGNDCKWRRCCIDGSIVAVEEGGWMEVSMAEGEILTVVVG